MSTVVKEFVGQMTELITTMMGWRTAIVQDSSPAVLDEIEPKVDRAMVILAACKEHLKTEVDVAPFVASISATMFFGSTLKGLIATKRLLATMPKPVCHDNETNRLLN